MSDNPQLENGYIRIANEIWDEVIRRDFSKRQKDILFLIWRLSYGCRKRRAYIPKLVYFELCGIGNNHIKKELLFLESCKVIIWDREEKKFEVNKHHEQWQMTPVKGWNELKFKELIALNLSESSQNGNKKVPETGTKNFPKQEHFEEEENENFPKQELLTSQNGNIFPEKVPEMGTSTPDEPTQDKGSRASKDIFKDIIKNSSSTKIVYINQDTEHAATTRNDYSYPRIYQIYAQHFASDGKVTEFEVQDLNDQFETYGGEWLLDAMREAVRHNKKSLAYINGVLKGYKKRGGTGEERTDQSINGPPEYELDENDAITQLMRRAREEDAYEFSGIHSAP